VINALVRSRKGSNRWKIRGLTWGRNARTVTRPGVLLAERFASAVASFEGRVGAFSHQAWMQVLANQVGQALSATNSASDSARSRQHSSPIASTKVASDKFTTNLVGSVSDCGQDQPNRNEYPQPNNDAHCPRNFGLPIDVITCIRSSHRFYSSSLVSRGRSFSSSERHYRTFQHRSSRFNKGGKQYACQKSDCYKSVKFRAEAREAGLSCRNCRSQSQRSPSLAGRCGSDLSVRSEAYVSWNVDGSKNVRFAVRKRVWD
jgi:hypothetical protein